MRDVLETMPIFYYFPRRMPINVVIFLPDDAHFVTFPQT